MPKTVEVVKQSVPTKLIDKKHREDKTIESMKFRVNLTDTPIFFVPWQRASTRSAQRSSEGDPKKPQTVDIGVFTSSDVEACTNKLIAAVQDLKEDYKVYVLSSGEHHAFIAAVSSPGIVTPINGD